VISQNNWDIVKTDMAYEIGHYRPAEAPPNWKIENSNWIVHKINRQK
jgi:hypothetical protein